MGYVCDSGMEIMGVTVTHTLPVILEMNSLTQKSLVPIFHLSNLHGSHPMSGCKSRQVLSISRPDSTDASRVSQSEMEDCTEEWTFPSNHFDFIHMRGLVGSIDDWDALFQKAWNCLRPGGWLESYEISPAWESDDDSIPTDSAMGQWGGIFIEGGRQSGRSFTVVKDEVQRKAMEAAGFQGIQEKNIKVPTPSS